MDTFLVRQWIQTINDLEAQGEHMKDEPVRNQWGRKKVSSFLERQMREERWDNQEKNPHAGKTAPRPKWEREFLPENVERGEDGKLYVYPSKEYETARGMRSKEIFWWDN
ncbi:hypothetical protein ACQR3P_29350 [Rhodococcus sp. IEGM1300]